MTEAADERQDELPYRRSPMTFETKLIITCILLGTALLYSVLAGLDTRKSLSEACEFIHRQVVVLPYGVKSDEAPYGVEKVYDRCLQAKAVPRP